MQSLGSANSKMLKIWMTWILFSVCLSVTFPLAVGEVPHMFRRLHKNGFHRDLYTSIKWAVKPHHKLDVRDCRMLLIQTLPSGLYVDPFQLKNMLQFGGPEVLLDKNVDIEKPEHFSPEHVLHVYTDLKKIRHDSHGAILSGSVTIPIHLRYHAPSDNPDTSYVNVVIPNPSFYTNCSLKDSTSLLQASCDHTNTSLCLWNEYQYHADKESIVCSVPVGNESHLPLVVTVTLLFTCGGCVFIMYIVFTKQTDPKKKVS